MARILVVDDSADINELLKHHLSLKNHDVTAVDMASNAISLLQQESFDLIISDVVMPGMNGVEFMNSISQMPGQFQVIFMSGAASETTAETLVRMGAYGFIKKPLNFEELNTLIDKSIVPTDLAVSGKNKGMNRAKVMVVDDMDAVASLLTSLLELQGFDVVTASDGEEALALFQRDIVDLVVTDLVMPKMNGVELIKNIKAMRPEVPIMAITGEAMNLSIQDALNYGASMCIRKPFNNKHFVDKVETLYMQFQRTQTRQTAVVNEAKKSRTKKLTWRERYEKEPVKVVGFGALILFSFLISIYVGTYAFIPAREGQSVLDIDDRMDQLIEAIRMDWGR